MKGRGKLVDGAGMRGGALTVMSVGQARPDSLIETVLGKTRRKAILGRAMEAPASLEVRSASSPYPTLTFCLRGAAFSAASLSKRLLGKPARSLLLHRHVIDDVKRKAKAGSLRREMDRMRPAR